MTDSWGRLEGCGQRLRFMYDFGARVAIEFWENSEAIWRRQRLGYSRTVEQREVKRWAAPGSVAARRAAAPDRDTTVLTGRSASPAGEAQLLSGSCFAQIEWLWHSWISREATGNFTCRSLVTLRLCE